MCRKDGVVGGGPVLKYPSDVTGFQSGNRNFYDSPSRLRNQRDEDGNSKVPRQ